MLDRTQTLHAVLVKYGGFESHGPAYERLYKAVNAFRFKLKDSTTLYVIVSPHSIDSVRATMKDAVGSKFAKRVTVTKIDSNNLSLLQERSLTFLRDRILQGEQQNFQVDGLSLEDFH